jgi:hypothetical protein
MGSEAEGANKGELKRRVRTPFLGIVLLENALFVP